MSKICDTNSRGLDEVKVTSSPNDLKDFLSGPVWTDLRTALEMMLKDVRDQLEQVSLEDLARCQGQAQILKLVLDLPENLLETLELEGQETNG